MKSFLSFLCITFFMRSVSQASAPHLYLICTDPNYEGNTELIFAIDPNTFEVRNSLNSLSSTIGPRVISGFLQGWGDITTTDSFYKKRVGLSFLKNFITVKS